MFQGEKTIYVPEDARTLRVRRNHVEVIPDEEYSRKVLERKSVPLNVNIETLRIITLPNKKDYVLVPAEEQIYLVEMPENKDKEKDEDRINRMIMTEIVRIRGEKIPTIQSFIEGPVSQLQIIPKIQETPKKEKKE